MPLKVKNHSIDSLFSFLLLLAFCLFALLLAGMGSAVYRNGTEHLNENYTSRTAIAYLSEKVRQHDRAGDIFLTEVWDENAKPDAANAVESAADVVEADAVGSAADAIGAAEGYPAIGFRDTVEGASFITYVYFYNGALCELFVREDAEPAAAMGSRIVELDSFEFESVDPRGTDLQDTDSREFGDLHLQDAHFQESGSIYLLTATAVSREGNSMSVLIPIRSR